MLQMGMLPSSSISNNWELGSLNPFVMTMTSRSESQKPTPQWGPLGSFEMILMSTCTQSTWFFKQSHATSFYRDARVGLWYSPYLTPWTSFYIATLGKIWKSTWQRWDMRIKNTSIKVMFYNIPCIRNQVAFQELSYVVNILWSKEFHIPTRLLTSCSNHPRKRCRPLLTNNISLARNLQIIVLDVYKTGSLLGWGFHALDTGYWCNFLATLKHP